MIFMIIYLVLLDSIKSFINFHKRMKSMISFCILLSLVNGIYLILGFEFF